MLLNMVSTSAETLGNTAGGADPADVAVSGRGVSLAWLKDLSKYARLAGAPDDATTAYVVRVRGALPFDHAWRYAWAGAWRQTTRPLGDTE
jgi:hypothetical protein